MASHDLSTTTPPLTPPPHATEPRCPSTPEQFEIAVICALPLEVDAIDPLFDRRWDDDDFPYDKASGDPNSYSIGVIGRHNVVLVYMPSMGKSSAAAAVASCRSTFTKIKLALVVGICGVAPFTPDGDEIVLGDIIISDALVQYDFGRKLPDSFVTKETIVDSLGRPNQEIRGVLSKLKTIRSGEMLESKVVEYMQVLQSRPKLKAKYPGTALDTLFEATYRHTGDGLCTKLSCDGPLVSRVRLEQPAPQPVVHFGLIASGDTVMKSGEDRDAIARSKKVIGFEMEGAGVWDNFPCLVIKGACDYADSHKTKIWQRYAAATAAAGMKAFLHHWASAIVKSNAQEKLEFIESLSPLVSNYEVQKNRNPERMAGTCEWVIEDPRFRHWQKSKGSSLLWVSADPGCGKSVLAKYLVDEYFSKENNTICYFFFKDGFENQSEVSSALRGLLNQIFSQRPALLSDDNFTEFKKVQESSDFQDLWRMFHRVTMCNNAKDIICIIDALDECEEEGRLQLLQALIELYNSESVSFSLKILVTSRPYAIIRQEFQPLETHHPTIHLSGENQIDQISKEIEIVVRARLEKFCGIHRLTDENKKDLIKEFTTFRNQTYLWVHLVFDELEKSSFLTWRDLISNIRSLPETVEEFYDGMLSRIKKRHEIERTKKLLHIIVAARRPLLLQEMAEALDIADYHQSHQDLKPLPLEQLRQNIRDACGLFVVIKDEKVYLLHQTAREFLVQPFSLVSMNGCKPLLKWQHSLNSIESNRILSQICIWYLLLSDFQDPNTFENGKSHNQYVLLDYAAQNWAIHFRQTNTEKREGLFSLALRLCSPPKTECPTWLRIYWLQNGKESEKRNPARLDVLMIASYFGLNKVVETLLDEKTINPTSRDSTYQRSALSWASENGHEDVVKLLLNKVPKYKVVLRDWSSRFATIVNAGDKNKVTPILYAVREGHYGIVEKLIKKGADVGARDRYRFTPLGNAAYKGYRDIVQLLLEKGADIEAREESGITPLGHAASKGHRDIVQLLLEKGADIEAREESGITPLGHAAYEGHRDVVQLLLEKGADIEARDKSGITPLGEAAYKGHRDIVQLLLKKGANIEARDKSGITPLREAASKGHRDIVQLLLKKGADIEARDESGITPLREAASKGYRDIVQLLLEKGADIEARDESGITPLGRATSMGSRDIVQLLLKKGARYEHNFSEEADSIL